MRRFIMALIAAISLASVADAATITETHSVDHSAAPIAISTGFAWSHGVSFDRSVWHITSVEVAVTLADTAGDTVAMAAGATEALYGPTPSVITGDWLYSQFPPIRLDDWLQDHGTATFSAGTYSGSFAFVSSVMTVTATDVPEPAAAAMLVLGLLALRRQLQRGV